MAEIKAKATIHFNSHGTVIGDVFLFTGKGFSISIDVNNSNDSNAIPPENRGYYVSIQIFDSLKKNGFNLDDYTLTDNDGSITIEAKKVGVEYKLSIISTNDDGVEIINPTEDVKISGVSVTDIPLKGQAVGSAVVSIGKGVAPFSFRWRRNNSTTWSSSSQNLTNVVAGTYQVTVTDAAGTSDSREVVIREPASLLISTITEIKNVGINKGSDGLVKIRISGGVSPYSWTWVNGSSGNGSAVERSSLSEGVYTVTVTDAWGGVVSQRVSISEPDSLALSYNLFGRDVSLSVLGGVSPYSWTWSDGSTVKDRQGLGSGDYTVAVRDIHGASASVSFTIAANGVDRFYFSENPVVLDLEAENAGTKVNLSFLANARVEKEYLSDEFEDLVSSPLRQLADENGKTSYDFSVLLSSQVGMHVPDFHQIDVERADALFKRFKLAHKESFGNPWVDQQEFSTETNYILAGGIENKKLLDSFFEGYLLGEMPFLDWKPKRKRVFREQHDYLYFLNNHFDTSSFQVKVKFYTIDGQEESAVLYTHSGVLNRYEVFCIPSGYTQIGAYKVNNRLGELDKYEIWVEDQDGKKVSQVRVFEIESFTPPNSRFFLYRNSLGTMSSLAVTGKQKLHYKTRKKTNGVEKIHSGERVHSGYTGYVRNAGEARALQDFLISRAVFWQYKDHYKSVEVSTGSRELVDEMDNIYSVKLKYTEETSAVYTPFLGSEFTIEELLIQSGGDEDVYESFGDEVKVVF